MFLSKERRPSVWFLVEIQAWGKQQLVLFVMTRGSG